MRMLILAVLAACGGSAQDVDTVIAAHHHDRTIAPSTTRRIRPWQVGQWTLSKVTSGNEIGYVRQSIVAQDACGIWLESAAQSRHGRTVSKACFRAAPTHEVDPTAELDALQAAMVRQGSRTVVVDFRNGQNPNTKRTMMANLKNTVTFAWESSPSDELTTVAVPAGRFEGVAHVVSRLWIDQSMQTVDTWIHPDVPISGAVKSVATDGSDSELLDYGLTGAKSELPGFDEHLRDTGMD
jgi:hypothetical protein